MMHHATDVGSLQALHELQRDRLAASAAPRGRPLRQRFVAVRVILAGWIAPRGVRPVRAPAARRSMDGTLPA